jgi:hypothetical protein
MFFVKFVILRDEIRMRYRIGGEAESHVAYWPTACPKSLEPEHVS